MSASSQAVPLQVVILAGGRGTRMYPLTSELPKALLPVRGRPFAHHQLELLAAGGITDVVYSIGHLGEMIRASVGDGSAFGVRVRYVDEGPVLRGTGGALRLCLAEGVLDPAFLVLYGDSYLPIDLPAVIAAFRRSGAPALMTVLRNEGRWDRSNVIFAGGVVELYDKTNRSPRMDHIDYGLSVLSRPLVERLPAGGPSDLSTLYHDLSKAKELAGLEVHRRFYEIGSPQGLRDLEEFLGDPSPGT